MHTLGYVHGVEQKRADGHIAIIGHGSQEPFGFTRCHYKVELHKSNEDSK
jgi:hypothetical protein